MRKASEIIKVSYRQPLKFHNNEDKCVFSHLKKINITLDRISLNYLIHLLLLLEVIKNSFRKPYLLLVTIQWTQCTREFLEGIPNYPCI